VDTLRDLVDGDQDEKDQDRKSDEDGKTQQNRRGGDLWPPRERFQRH
jgi:hypothetical protein